MFNKKAFVTSPADLLKGFFVGLLIGLVLAFLLMKGYLPIPLGPLGC